MKIQLIPLEKINIKDFKYSCSYPLEDKNLTSSIKKNGILNPIYISQKNKSVISGAKRIAAATKLKLKQIPCVILDIEDDSKLFLFNLHENLTTRSFNPIEKGLILDKLINLCNLTKYEIIQNYAEALGLNKSMKILDNHISLLTLPESAKKRLITGKLYFDTALKLTELESNNQLLLFNLIINMKLNRNQANQILDLIYDISAKEDIDPKALINNINSKNNFEDLRNKLYSRMYPLFSKTQNEIISKIKKIKLPANIRINVHPSFEEKKINLTFEVKNSGDIKTLAETIKNSNFEKEINELLNLLP